MFGDLSVYHHQSENVTKQVDETLSSLGFQCVFSNFLITTKSNEGEKQISEFISKTQKRDNTLPLHSVKKSCLDVIGDGKCLRVFSRVTLALQQSDKISQILDLVKRLYNRSDIDCFCIRPANDSQLIDLLNLHSVCDLISIDLSNGNFFQQIGSSVKALKNSETVVELELSQTIRGSAELTNLISQSKLVLTRVTTATVSSGAKTAFDLKSPIDMRNWGANMLGLRGCERNAQRVIEAAAKKRMIRLNLFPSV